MHEGCKGVLPQSNTDYWIHKLQANRERDKENKKNWNNLDDVCYNCGNVS